MFPCGIFFVFLFCFVIRGQLVVSPGCELACVVVDRWVDVMERGRNRPLCQALQYSFSRVCAALLMLVGKGGFSSGERGCLLWPVGGN